MREKYLAKAELQDGQYYYGHCRNAEIARWNGKRGEFVYRRRKFGTSFLETILHPEDEKRWDVFYPERVASYAEVGQVGEIDLTNLP